MDKLAAPPLPSPIGLIGPSGAGKDTVARFLVEDHGFTQFAFADALRELAEAVNPHYRAIVREHGYEEAKRTSTYVREYLVRLGNGVRTHIGRDTWVDVLNDGLCGDALRRGERVVVSDVRFDNEADWIEYAGGVLVSVGDPAGASVPSFDAGEADRIGRLMLRPDYGIENDGTLEDLRHEVEDLVDNLEWSVVEPAGPWW